MRLYAEDPRTFLPQAGRLERLRLPETIRVESGVAAGDEIGTGYDPMIAKLIAAGATREEALDRLAAALDATEVGGVTTNLPFLRWLVAHPVLRARRDDHRVPDRASPALGPAGRAAGSRLARGVPPQPAVAARPAPRRRSMQPPATTSGRAKGRARSSPRCQAP